MRLRSHYNISGRVHCGSLLNAACRVEDWCNVLRKVLRTDDVGIISHFTGGTTIIGDSSTDFVVSSGLDVHEFCMFVQGDRAHCDSFARTLEAALMSAGLPYSLLVHDQLQTLTE